MNIDGSPQSYAQAAHALSRMPATLKPSLGDPDHVWAASISNLSIDSRPTGAERAVARAVADLMTYAPEVLT